MISKSYGALKSNQCFVNPIKTVGPQESAVRCIKNALLLQLHDLRNFVRAFTY